MTTTSVNNIINNTDLDKISQTVNNGRRDKSTLRKPVTGIISCFIATFVTVAAAKGIRLSKLNVNTECIINFAKTFVMWQISQ
jgi:hypothetical protein